MNEKMKKIERRVLGVVLFLLGIPALSIGNFGILGIALGAGLFVAGVMVWNTAFSGAASGPDDVMEAVCETEEVSIRDLYEAFSHMDTPLGRPWIGEVKYASGESLIFGPSVNKEYIYLFQAGAAIYICRSNFAAMLLGPRAELKKRKKEKRVLQDGEALMKEIRNKVLEYIKKC